MADETRLITVKRGTKTQWNNEISPLEAGELGYDITDRVYKGGDGSSSFNAISEFATMDKLDKSTTFATTSTDDATSPTAAPLKSAGGLAVAKDIWCGGDIKVRRGLTRGVSLSNVPANTWTATGLVFSYLAGGLLYVGEPGNNHQKSLYAFLRPGAAFSGVVTQLANGGHSYGIQVRILQATIAAIEVYHTHSSAITINVSLLELF